MIKTIPTFTATFSIGLQKGYTQKFYKKREFIAVLQTYQNKLIKERGIYLSTRITPSDIILSGQVEPHLTFEFINYPRFELSPQVLKEEVLHLTNHLMKIFNQNRIVIVFTDETLMLEESSEINPKIL